MRSPFKFLDSFQQNDAQEFFGRDQEIALLYNFVNKNRLVLVYGISGTGKTSLIQCGLSSRFDATDWFPITVRRVKNLNESLKTSLLNTVEGVSPEIPTHELVARINARYLRPVYLIFDQLEELLIYGEEKEQNEFIGTVKEILQNNNLDCHILFVLREEFLARLYNFEKSIPNLFDRRLRIEYMRDENLVEVISGSAEKFNISFEQPEDNIAQIIESLRLEGKSDISLAYLQVYLDMFWREDYLRTYPGSDLEELNANLLAKKYPKLEFTTKEITDFGKIKDILARFLEEQTTSIEHEIKENTISVKKVLDSFVSTEGTNKPMPYSAQEDSVRVDEKGYEYLKNIPNDLLMKVLRLLEKSRILRFTSDSIELAHDILAALIDQQRSDRDRWLNELHNRMKNNYQEHLHSGEFLSRKQLTILEEYKTDLYPKLDQAVVDFIYKSEKVTSQKEQDERKKSKRVRTIILAFALLSLAAFIYSQIARAKAQDALKKANKEIVNREQLEIVDYLQRGKHYLNSGDYDLALTIYKFLQDSMFTKEAHENHENRKEVEDAIRDCETALKEK